MCAMISSLDAEGASSAAGEDTDGLLGTTRSCHQVDGKVVDVPNADKNGHSVEGVSFTGVRHPDTAARQPGLPMRFTMPARLTSPPDFVLVESPWGSMPTLPVSRGKTKRGSLLSTLRERVRRALSGSTSSAEQAADAQESREDSKRTVADFKSDAAAAAAAAAGDGLTTSGSTNTLDTTPLRDDAAIKSSFTGGSSSISCAWPSAGEGQAEHSSSSKWCTVATGNKAEPDGMTFWDDDNADTDMAVGGRCNNNNNNDDNSGDGLRSPRNTESDATPRHSEEGYSTPRRHSVAEGSFDAAILTPDGSTGSSRSGSLTPLRGRGRRGWWQRRRQEYDNIP